MQRKPQSAFAWVGACELLLQQHLAGVLLAHIEELRIPRCPFNVKCVAELVALPRRQPATFNNRFLRAVSFRRHLLTEVARFDIVTIEVEHERGVVIVAVLAPKPRRPVILRAGFERRGMELMHSLFACGA